MTGDNDIAFAQFSCIALRRMVDEYRANKPALEKVGQLAKALAEQLDGAGQQVVLPPSFPAALRAANEAIEECRALVQKYGSTRALRSSFTANTLRDHLESARARVQAAMELLLAAGLQVDTQTLQDVRTMTFPVDNAADRVVSALHEEDAGLRDTVAAMVLEQIEQAVPGFVRAIRSNGEHQAALYQVVGQCATAMLAKGTRTGTGSQATGDLSREIRAVAEKVAEIQAAMGSSSAAGAVQADQLSDALHAPVERAIMTALQARTEAVQAALRSVQFQTPDEERQVKRRLMELREELRIRDAHDQNRFVEPTADPLPFVNPADIDNYLRTPGEAGRGGPLQVPEGVVRDEGDEVQPSAPLRPAVRTPSPLDNLDPEIRACLESGVLTMADVEAHLATRAERRVMNAPTVHVDGINIDEELYRSMDPAMIARFVREHKAARAAQQRARPAAPPQAAPQSQSADDNAGDDMRASCCVCFSNPRSHAFHPCNHLALCMTCAARIPDGRCPICRTPGQARQIYFA